MKKSKIDRYIVYKMFYIYKENYILYNIHVQ